MAKVLLAATLFGGLMMSVAGTAAPPLLRAEPGRADHVMFSINVQDFAYPEKIAATVRKVIDIHEKYRIPVDIYLTTTMTDLYEADAPQLLERLRTSVAGRRDRLVALNDPMLLPMLGRADAGTAAGPDDSSTKLYLSGTMHIETNRRSWPGPDRLIEFFRRATAAGKGGGRPSGMRWSIGADIGWLEGEPRAAEVIKATEALGVEWDVHAHQLEDRANVAAAIGRLGGHPNRVASRALVRELDNLRDTIRGRDGASWRAEVLWGMALRPLHGPGADDNASVLWRPRSVQDWSLHDPAGRLIAVGGGTRRLADAERLARAPGSGGDSPPVVSATIMVSPRTFTVVGTPDGIEAIEAWASRVGALPAVRWATIRETADAWVAAGGIPSRRAE